MLKSLDRKFLILAASILITPVVLILLLSALQGCQSKGTSYDKYEKKMIQAATKYLKSNKLLPKNEGDVVKVSLSTLVNKNLIKSPENALKDSNCTGNVSVRRNGVFLEKNNEGSLNYISNLKCEKYETQTLSNLLKKEIVSSESGLYNLGDEYIFKGDKAKNYITFFGKSYRIMGITSDGLIKLVKSDSETITRMWDNKYNSEIKFSYGKTIYKDSILLKYLLVDYFNNKKISEDARKHVVANNTCIGKRSKDNINIDKALDCSEVIENQLISVMSISDYSMASIDPDCNSISSRSCNNYNYLYQVASSTWTSNSILENSYQAIYLGGGTSNILNANTYNYYNIVIYIDGDEKVASGFGTSEDPFIIN